MTIMQNNSVGFRLRNLSKYRTELYGFGILWIMLYHNQAGYPAWLGWVLNYGNIGCEVFLFVSGISLYYAMQKGMTLSCYLERRLSRLLIPLWTTSVWEWLYLLSQRQIRFLQFASRMTLTEFWMSGRQQSWFLSLLLLAYLIYPYLYSFLYDEGRSSLALRTAVVEFVAVGFILMFYHLVPAYYSLVEIGLSRLPVFILGVALGWAVYEDVLIPRRRWLIATLLLVVLASFWILNSYYLSSGDLRRRLFNMVPGIALVLLLSQVFERTEGILNRVLVFFGSMSIELYLLHLLLRRLLRGTSFYDQDQHLHYFAMLAVAVALAWIVSKLDRYLIDRFVRPAKKSQALKRVFCVSLKGYNNPSR